MTKKNYSFDCSCFSFSRAPSLHGHLKKKIIPSIALASPFLLPHPSMATSPPPTSPPSLISIAWFTSIMTPPALRLWVLHLHHHSHGCLLHRHQCPLTHFHLQSQPLPSVFPRCLLPLHRPHRCSKPVESDPLCRPHCCLKPAESDPLCCLHCSLKHTKSDPLRYCRC